MKEHVRTNRYSCNILFGLGVGGWEEATSNSGKLIEKTSAYPSLLPNGGSDEAGITFFVRLWFLDFVPPASARSASVLVQRPRSVQRMSLRPPR